MDGRTFVALVVLSGVTLLVRIYRQVRTKVDAVSASASAPVTHRGRLTPRFSITIPGFGTFGVKLSDVKEAQRVLQSMNETIRLKFNPADPPSAHQALRQVNRDIDAAIAPYPHNKMLVEAAAKLKSDYQQVLEKQIEKHPRAARERR